MIKSRTCLLPGRVWDQAPEEVGPMDGQGPHCIVNDRVLEMLAFHVANHRLSIHWGQLVLMVALDYRVL